MKPEERLIVAADFDPRKVGGVEGVHDELGDLAMELSGTGVIIKVNSILRAMGYGIIEALHEQGLKVFADLKLNDIPNTMETDAALLFEHKPDILTVMCSAGVEGMRRVQDVLPDTDVLGVTVLTSLTEQLCRDVYRCSPEDGVIQFAFMAQQASLAGVISSPKELVVLMTTNGLDALQFNTPGIRPLWAIIEDDDQARHTTPKQAIMNGADRIVVGRPITQAENPRDAVLRTIEEIEQGLEKVA